METFKERLSVEKHDLDEKLSRLESFINSDKFEKIKKTQQSLLRIQLYAMQTYSQILFERIIFLK